MVLTVFTFLMNKKTIKEIIARKIENQQALLLMMITRTSEIEKNVRKSINRLEDYRTKVKGIEGEIVSDVAPSLRGWEGLASKIYFIGERKTSMIDVSKENRPLITYIVMYIYTNDRIYGLMVTDRQKASAFYNRYGDKAVGENNLFVEKTLERDWRTAMSHYRGLKGEFTNWYQALAYLLAKYETGLALVYFDKGENAGYQAVGVNSVRDSNGFYRPTKCR